MGPGTDVLRLGFSGILPSTNTVDGIGGVIRYTGGTSGGSVVADDSTDTTGDTLHVDQGSVGAFPGDNLFGAGGALFYSNITALTITLGTGADTVYVVPNLVTTITIDGNGPAGAGSSAGSGGSGAAASDFLGLADAKVTNPVFTPNGGTAGSFIFGNAARVTYSRIESTAIDDVALHRCSEL